MIFLLSCPAACASLLVASTFWIDLHVASNYYQLSSNIFFWLPDTVGKVVKALAIDQKICKLRCFLLFCMVLFICCAAFVVQLCSVFISTTSSTTSKQLWCHTSVLIYVYHSMHASFFHIWVIRTFTVNCVLILVHAMQELGSSLHVRRSFWWLIMTSNKTK